MNPKVMLFLFFGVGIVGVVMFLNASKPAVLKLKHHAPSVVYVRAFVAKHNLQVGHWISARNDLTEKTFVLGAEPPGAVLVTQGVVGDVVRSPVMAGDVLMQEDVATQDDPDFLSYALPVGKGAISIVLSKQNSVDNFVQPGERVDVLVRIMGTGVGGKVTQIVLSNVRVLSINHHLNQQNYSHRKKGYIGRLVQSRFNLSQQHMKQQSAVQQAASSTTSVTPTILNPNAPLVVTFEVTPEEAATLMQATNIGVVSLMLRSVRDDSHDIGEISAGSGSMIVYNGPK